MSLGNLHWKVLTLVTNTVSLGHRLDMYLCLQATYIWGCLLPTDKLNVVNDEMMNSEVDVVNQILKTSAWLGHLCSTQWDCNQPYLLQ